LTCRSAGNLRAPEITEDARGEIPTDDDIGDFFGDMLCVVGFAASENDDKVFSINGDEETSGLLMSNASLLSSQLCAAVDEMSQTSSTPDFLR